VLNWKLNKPILVAVEELEKKFICLAGVALQGKRDVQSILEVAKSCRDKFGVVLQVVDANCIASWRHAASAALRALRAFAEGRNVCDRVEVEIILYISGRRQIRDAIEAVGVKSDSTELAVICASKDSGPAISAVRFFVDSVGGVIDNSALEIRSDEKVNVLRRIFDVSNVELDAVVRSGIDLREAIERIVIERGALLEVLK